MGGLFSEIFLSVVNVTTCMRFWSLIGVVIVVLGLVIFGGYLALVKSVKNVNVKSKISMMEEFERCVSMGVRVSVVPNTTILTVSLDPKYCTEDLLEIYPIRIVEVYLTPPHDGKIVVCSRKVNISVPYGGEVYVTPCTPNIPGVFRICVKFNVGKVVCLNNTFVGVWK